MPAIGTEAGKSVNAPKKKLVRKKPTQTAGAPAARAQEQQYASQGRAVEKQANTQRAASGRRLPASQAKGRAPEEQQLLSQAHSVRLSKNRQQRNAQLGLPATTNTRQRGTSPAGDRPQDRQIEASSPVIKAGIKRARIRVLNKQGRGAGIRAVAKIPSTAAGALAHLGDVAAQNVREHGPQVMGSSGSSVVQQSNLPATKLAENLAKDAANFPAQAVTSGYDVAAGIKEASTGRPQRLKRIVKAFDASDPVWNAAAAGVAAATGDSETAKQRLAVAKTSVQEHPGYAIAEAAGVRGTAGRGLGKTMRSGALGPAAKRAASTAKAPKTLEGTSIEVHREYSPDVFTKLGQRLNERTATGDRKPSTRVNARDLNKRVDERVAVSGTDRAPFVEEFAAKKNGKVQVFTATGAERHARALTDRTGIEFTTVPHGPTTRAVVPKPALQRLAEHGDVKPKTSAGRTISLANDAFRKTVLTTSTSWAAGNVIEAGMRGALAKAGPRSYIQGRRIVKAVERIDPAKAEELAARVTGGGHYSLAERNTIKDIAEHFAGTAVEPMATALHSFWQHPVPKTTAGVWRTWNKGVFQGMRALESQFQVAQLGAAVRRSELMDGHLFKLSNSAVEEAARGLTNTNTQVRFARQVERAYGKYNGFSPATKMVIAHYSPFVAWFLNSVKFVADVLPRDHPTTTGLIAAAELATEDWRKDHGLDLWMQGAVPGWLQGSIPTAGGGKRRISKFTPFGAFGDLPDTLSGQVLPLYSGPLLALKGLAWNGQPLNRKKKGEAEKTEGEQQVHNAMTAIGEFLDATIPIVSQAKRVGDKGVGALNPFAPVPPKPKKIRKISGPRRIKLGGELNGGRVDLGSLNGGRVDLGSLN